MRAIKLRRPSPALVLAGIALFIVLGGTGYAATHSKKAAKPVTKAQVNKLVASYVKSHQSQLTGPAGGPGAAGGVGPQGPGAFRLAASNAHRIDRRPCRDAGPWTSP